jgi:hypothetical protein
LKPKYDHKVIRPNGRWVPAVETDIAKRFEKIKRENEKIRKERAEKVTKLNWRAHA